MKTTRRNFVKIATVAGAGMFTDGLIQFNAAEKDIKFLSPLDGDMLCEYDGIVYPLSQPLHFLFNGAV